MAYTEPIVWIAGENASAPKLNAVNDNIRALRDPVSLVQTTRGAVSNDTTTLLTYVPLVSLNGGNVLTTGGRLHFNLDLSGQHSIAAGILIFDILIDGTTYLSSMTTTPVTNGLWALRIVTAAIPYQLNGHHVLPAGLLAAGNHSFVPQWRISVAGTGTILHTGYTAQLSISE